MDIKQAKFIISLPRYANFPGIGLPEIAAVGRSNVGKSSLINRVLGRNALAKVSGTPGKTRLLNVYRVNEAFNLIDLPGYGYAKVPKDMQNAWANLCEGYFATSGLLSHVLHLVDIRHEPTGEDRGMRAFLRDTGIPYTIVATKADKLSRAQRAAHVFEICRALEVQPWQVIPFSTLDGTGVDALLSVFEGITSPATQVDETANQGDSISE